MLTLFLPMFFWCCCTKIVGKVSWRRYTGASPSFEQLWDDSVGAPSVARSASASTGPLAVDSQGNVYTAGGVGPGATTQAQQSLLTRWKSDGTLDWSHQLPAPPALTGVAASPDGKLAVYNCAASTICLDASTGATVWTATVVGSGRPTWSKDSKAVFVIVGGHVVKINAADGSIAWNVLLTVNGNNIPAGEVLLDADADLLVAAIPGTPSAPGAGIVLIDQDDGSALWVGGSIDLSNCGGGQLVRFEDGSFGSACKVPAFTQIVSITGATHGNFTLRWVDANGGNHSVGPFALNTAPQTVEAAIVAAQLPGIFGALVSGSSSSYVIQLAYATPAASNGFGPGNLTNGLPALFTVTNGTDGAITVFDLPPDLATGFGGGYARFDASLWVAITAASSGSYTITFTDAEGTQHTSASIASNATLAQFAAAVRATQGMEKAAVWRPTSPTNRFFVSVPFALASPLPTISITVAGGDAAVAPPSNGLQTRWVFPRIGPGTRTVATNPTDGVAASGKPALVGSPGPFHYNPNFETAADNTGAIDLYFQAVIPVAVPSDGSSQNATPTSCYFRGQLTGSQNSINVYAFNWSGGSWDALSPASIAGVDITGLQLGVDSLSELIFALSPQHAGTGANAGQVRIRFAGSGLVPTVTTPFTVGNQCVFWVSALTIRSTKTGVQDLGQFAAAGGDGTNAYLVNNQQLIRLGLDGKMTYQHDVPLAGADWSAFPGPAAILTVSPKGKPHVGGNYVAYQDPG